MGCLHKVFATEIDVELFERGRARRAGFGAVKLAARAAARAARSRSSRRSTARAATSRASNRRFFDWPEAAPGAVRAFDLRDRLCDAA